MLHIGQALFSPLIDTHHYKAILGSLLDFGGDLGTSSRSRDHIHIQELSSRMPLCTTVVYRHSVNGANAELTRACYLYFNLDSSPYNK